MTHIDSFYKQGNFHSVCQDYTIHNNDIVIVSDGCSTAKNTDVGARLLAHCAQETLNMSYSDTIDYTDTVRKFLGLPLESLCATLITAGITNNNINVDAIGDFCMVSRKRVGGILDFFNLEFKSGAPYYLSYELDNQRETYLNNFGDSFIINGEIQPKGFFDSYPDGVIRKEFTIADYDLVAIFSDGINSFQSTTNNKIIPVSREEIAREILAFKGYAGNFVQRRCQKAFKEFEKLGYKHYDDFSVGVIKIDG